MSEPPDGAPDASDTFGLDRQYVRLGRVRVCAGGEETISDLRVRVGRADDNDVVLASMRVSKHHVEIEPAAGGALVRDLGSTAGTCYERARIREAIVPLPARLVLGEEVTLEITNPGDAVETVPEDAAFGPLVGAGPVMQQLRVRIKRFASSDWDVVIFGETGTGKELVARCLHDLSRRASGPFEIVNCAVMPSGLIESELFGHERGAFDGAGEARAGPFERADGGTVFLDELGELPLSSQARLLRVLENRQVQRLGVSRPRKVDVRVLAATNRNLAAEVAAGRFREDLYHRFSLPLHVAPLRERLEDVPRLVEHFLAIDRATAPPGSSLSATDLAGLRSRPWPGNVRELRNAVRQALAGLSDEQVSGGDVLDPEFLLSLDKASAERAFERWYVTRLLERHRTRTAAAQAMGIERSTLYKRLALLSVGHEPSD